MQPTDSEVDKLETVDRLAMSSIRIGMRTDKACTVSNAREVEAEVEVASSGDGAALACGGN
jgi:hypothetical protein